MAPRIPDEPETPEERVETAEGEEAVVRYEAAPEAWADRVPADIRPGRGRPDEAVVAQRADRRTERAAAVPGVGGGEVPPSEYAATPTVHLKRPLATHAHFPEVGHWPIPPDEGEPQD
jgi:hypothetical protein